MNFRNRAGLLGCQVPVIGIFYPRSRDLQGEAGTAKEAADCESVLLCFGVLRSAILG